jgi:hypothetical protein
MANGRAEIPKGWTLVESERRPTDGDWLTWNGIFRSQDAVVTLTVAADGEVVAFGVTSVDQVRTPGTTERAITARSVRAIPFGELADVVRSLPVVRHGQSDDGRIIEALASWEGKPIARPGSKPGRKPRPDLYYAQLAYTYRLWQGTGHPLGWLAEITRRSEAGLRTALRVTRDRGFLTEAPRGRKGGKPTKKAYRVMDQYLSEHPEDPQSDWFRLVIDRLSTEEHDEDGEH